MLEIDGSGKEVIRALHSGQRADRLAKNRRFVNDRYDALSGCFAAGSDINPSKISPVFERVYSETEESRMFRLAALTWSVPVSNGYRNEHRRCILPVVHGADG